MYIDFKELKQRVSIEAVSEVLGLTLTQHADSNQRRGSCPRCNESDDRALVVSPGKGYYCFSAKEGGDCIALAAHILNLPMKEAAQYIVEHVNDAPDIEPEEAPEVPKRVERGGVPLQPLTYLDFKHEAVRALGIDAETAESLGIGYAKKGMMRGRVVIPIRRDDGTLVGYCGYARDVDPILKFPKSLVSL